MTKARTILDDTRSIEIVQLLPSWVCEAVMDRCKGPFMPMEAQAANRATMILLSAYPYGFKGDEDAKIAYMRRIESLFALYPEWAASAVLDVGKGIASTSSFLPSEAELKQCLEDQITRIRSYAVKAQWHIDEGVRRAKQQDLDSACSKLSPEAKAALVSKAFARIKPMSDDQPHTQERAA